MWLQRVLFNIQTRLLGQELQQQTTNRFSRPSRPSRETKRVRLFQDRLLDLDRRLAQLQSR